MNAREWSQMWHHRQLNLSLLQAYYAVYAYLESVRVSHAEQLLRAGKPLVDVAYAVGYSSQAHFTQRFKQIIGVTPGKYVQHR